MSPKNLSERIDLLSILDSYGDEGATLPEIQKDWLNRKDAKHLDQKQFIRCRKDIQELFGVEIKCKRSKFDSKYYVSRGGADSFLRMTSLNAFLLQNIIDEPGFPKNRVYIGSSYADNRVGIVSRAISLGRNLKVKQKRIKQEMVTEDGITYPKSVTKGYIEFEFVPYAIAYISQWFMFGKNTDSDELLVYALRNAESITLSFDYGYAPKEFDVSQVLEHSIEYFPTRNGSSFPDDRLILLCAARTSSFKLF